MGTIDPIMSTTTRRDLVSQLLFGSTRRKVLALLLGRPDERFYLREIVRAVGGGLGAVQRELKQLVAAGLVEREARGHQVYFSANRDAAVFPELRAIVEKTSGTRMATARKPPTRLALRRKIHRLRGPILAAAEASGASEVRVFGSVARGEDSPKSDIDFLVSLEPGRTLLDLTRLETRLENLLERRVDVVTPENLRAAVRKTVLQEAVPV